MSIANYVTIFRVLISPVFLLVYINYQNSGLDLSFLPIILFGLLALSEFTDFLDGFLARKYNQVTDLGKIFDPMADSIYRLSVFLTFTLPPVNLSMLIIFALFYRDSVISTLRTICAMKGFTLAARPSGKIKAVLQGFAALFILIWLLLYYLNHFSQEQMQTYSMWTGIFAAIYSLWSGYDYLSANKNYILQLIKNT